jgi:hypothetical protein
VHGETREEGERWSEVLCLDILGNGYVLETKTVEEMGEIFFNSPANFSIDREVHPPASFLDTHEGMKTLKL